MTAPRTFPALDIRWPPGSDPDDAFGRLLAAIDDARPTSAEETADGARVFFASAGDRDRAAAIIPAGLTYVAVAVPDEGWAERSQASLSAIHVGRITVAPPWAPEAQAPAGGDHVSIVIQPSMGFGTGHHASTRLCLSLMQQIDVARTRVLDLGTGSGVLAIAAVKLGAASVLAIDFDPDALTSAAENLELNGAPDRVTLQSVDLSRETSLLGGSFDLVLANLTGAMLAREAQTIAGLIAPNGRLIVSGVEAHEAETVERSFASAGLTIAGREDADGWVGVLF